MRIQKGYFNFSHVDESDNEVIILLNHRVNPSRCSVHIEGEGGTNASRIRYTLSDTSIIFWYDHSFPWTGEYNSKYFYEIIE